MPRTGARKTLKASTDPAGSSFKVESAAAAATVDVLDTDFSTNFGFTPSGIVEVLADFKFDRTPIAVVGDEAADTIGLASVKRNAGNTGYTVTFSATAAAGKKVGVRVTRL
jgi:hypothetical protein